MSEMARRTHYCPPGVPSTGLPVLLLSLPLWAICRWMGYGETGDTWEPPAQLDQDQALYPLGPAAQEKLAPPRVAAGAARKRPQGKK